MKEMLTRNLNLKILSLLIAFLLWLVIINIEDPAIIASFSDIPVTVINEEALDEVDKVYNIESGDVIDIEVKGKRSVVENLSRSDFVATADLNALSIVNAMEIKVSVPKYNNQIEIIDQNVTTMEITLEDLVTEQFRVDIVESGTVREGFYISEKTASPNIVQLSGAESVINKVSDVVVRVNVSGADKTFIIKETPQVYDHNGTLMDPEKLDFSHTEFEISVNLLETKTVNLIMELEGQPAFGYEYIGFEYEPKEVVIAGTKEELEKVPLVKATYNINNARADIEDEINISDYIKEDVILIHEHQNAVINVDIEELDSKEVSIPTSIISTRNIPDNMRVVFLNSGPVVIEVTGLLSEISKINVNNIRPYIDLAEFDDDRGSVPIQFELDAENVEFSSVNILIELENRN